MLFIAAKVEQQMEQLNDKILRVLERHACKPPADAANASAEAEGAVASLRPFEIPHDGSYACGSGGGQFCNVGTSLGSGRNSCCNNGCCCTSMMQSREELDSSCCSCSGAVHESSDRGKSGNCSSNSDNVAYRVWYDPDGRLCQGLALLFCQQLQAALKDQQQQVQQLLQQSEQQKRSRQRDQRRDTASLIVEGLVWGSTRSSCCSSVAGNLPQQQQKPSMAARAAAATSAGTPQALSSSPLEDLFDLCAGLTKSGGSRSSSSASSSSSSKEQEVYVFLFVESENGRLVGSSAALAAEAAEALTDRRVCHKPLQRCILSVVCCDTATAATGEVSQPSEREQQQLQEQQLTEQSKMGDLCRAAVNGNSFSSRTNRLLKKLGGNLARLGAASLQRQQQRRPHQQQQQQLFSLTLCTGASPSTTASKYCQWTERALQLALHRQQVTVATATDTGECNDNGASSNLSEFSYGSTDEEEAEQQQPLHSYVGGCGEGASDMEDLGGGTVSSSSPSSSLLAAAASTAAAGTGVGDMPEQLTASLRRNLTKEGYKLVGTHSAVKVCRWTRAALRGRGGCYKHTFYGIKSYGCMEFTASVACANRCLFCWRHHTNLAAGDWRWKADEPADILRDAVSRHLIAIKELKGLPGLRRDFFSQVDNKVLHCALSLVGEPIMYPRINELLFLMHQQHISTFLVTNAQHPDALSALRPVTQLYLSIDAATESDLKRLGKIISTHVLWRMLLLRKMLHAIWCDMAWLTMRADKPVHRDYWARFLRCIDILKTKKQRTVFRLTLVHGYNCRLVPTTAERECPVEVSSSSGSTSSSSRSGSTNTNRGKAAVDVTSTIEGYASLVLRGEPDLIEIKGMTFCGGLDRESLSMNNVPRHQQVLDFAEALLKVLPEGRPSVGKKTSQALTTLCLRLLGQPSEPKVAGSILTKDGPCIMHINGEEGLPPNSASSAATPLLEV
ncbi:radical SAM domain-containing protein, putative [Eimeria maxima]|uniref:Radical SAM domain-containing protein, putative n=1 Tax=Eimeria maxima TaxID=5804 RepID=U6MFK0_EIMMA|nr:radical SAM domain-containing protein, putative [Eimeria maxima]CDJ61234.1 radical SAM domain-containing protein, putative [Eimeria maxima]